MKEKIMIDMDDVIVSGGFLYLINEFLNTNYIEADFKDYYMQNIIQDKKSFFEFFLKRNMYDHCYINKNAYETLQKLNEFFEVYIGTSYIFPEAINESGIILLHKHNFLVKNFPFLNPYNFIFLGDKSVLNCEIKIDDKISNLKNAKTKLLYTAYHNKDIADKELSNNSIIRVDNWLDIEKKLIKRGVSNGN